jgi:hypothetical protein
MSASLIDTCHDLGIPAEFVRHNSEHAFWRVDVPDTNVTMLIGWADPHAVADAQYDGDYDDHDLDGIYDDLMNWNWDASDLGMRPYSDGSDVRPGWIAVAGVYVDYVDEDAGYNENISLLPVVVDHDGWPSTLRYLMTAAVQDALDHAAD